MKRAGAEEMRPFTVQTTTIEFARLRRAAFRVGGGDVEPVIENTIKFYRLLPNNGFRCLVPAAGRVTKGPDRMGPLSADVLPIPM